MVMAKGMKKKMVMKSKPKAMKAVRMSILKKKKKAPKAKQELAVVASEKKKGLRRLESLAPGEPLGHSGAQAVKDHLLSLEKAGWDFPLEEWGRTKGHEAKRSLALKIAFDREGSFFKVMEKESLENLHVKAATCGWMHLWEVAQAEGLTYRPKDKNNQSMLMDHRGGPGSRF